MLYRQFYFVNKGGKTVNLRFLNKINVLMGNVYFSLKILWKCSFKAATVAFEHTRQLFGVILQCQINSSSKIQNIKLFHSE